MPKENPQFPHQPDEASAITIHVSQVDYGDPRKDSEPDMRVAWLFPGQGSQKVGMGAHLYEHFDEAKALYDAADTVLGFPISAVSFHGPEDLLTQNAQKAIFLHSYVNEMVLNTMGKDGFRKPAGFRVGQSLGQYNALVSAGAISFEDGLRLIAAREAGMQYACQINPGRLVAIMKPGNMPYETFTEEIIATLQHEFQLSPSNYNSTDQIVVGGSVAAIEKAQKYFDQLRKNQRVKAIPLDVAGAFHTDLMAPAQEQLAEALTNTPIHSLEDVAVIDNVTAQPVTNADEIRRNLLLQLTSPVRWQESMQYLADHGVSKTYELGDEKSRLSKMNAVAIGGAVVGTVGIGVSIGATVWHRHHKKP